MSCRISNSKFRDAIYFAVASFVVVACDSAEVPKRNAPKQDSGNQGGAQAANAGATTAQASPTPCPSDAPATTCTQASPTPVPSGSAACNDQWTKNVATFKVGSKLTYTASITSPSPLMLKPVPLQHTEEVTASSDAQVDRKVLVSSADVFVSGLLNMMMLPTTVSVKKDQFLTMCQKAADSAASPVTFMGSDIQVIESRDDSIVLAGQTKAVRYVRLKGNVNAMGTMAAANIQVWMSKETPGLVLKQISDLSGLPLVTTATITDELASQSGM